MGNVYPVPLGVWLLAGSMVCIIIMAEDTPTIMVVEDDVEMKD